jgi:hypothetical protein
LCPYSETFFNP